MACECHVWVAALIIMGAPVVRGQAQHPAPSTFEVASVKRHIQNGPSAWAIIPSAKVHGISGNQFRQDGVTVTDLIRDAYGVRAYQVIGAPRWAAGDSDRFDIIAKTQEGPPPSNAQVRLMLQALLSDRFRLRVHLGSKQMPVYELVAAKNGPKLKEVRPDPKPLDRGIPGANRVMRTSMEVLVFFISEYVERPVVDKTGLTASEYEYGFNQTELREELRETLPVPSIFSALQDQLGLMLRAANAQVATVVVDRVEQPSAN
jgi:uncharacterized protein (TIGR03435 family)